MNINKNKIISLFLGASLVLNFGNCIIAQQSSVYVISKLDDKSVNKQEIYNGKKGSGIIEKIILVTFGSVIAIFSIPIIFTIHQKRLDFLPEIVKNSLRLYNFNPESEFMSKIKKVETKDNSNKNFFNGIKENNLILRIPILGKHLINPIILFTFLIDYAEENLKFKLFLIKELTYDALKILKKGLFYE